MIYILIPCSEKWSTKQSGVLNLIKINWFVKAIKMLNIEIVFWRHRQVENGNNVSRHCIWHRHNKYRVNDQLNLCKIYDSIVIQRKLSKKNLIFEARGLFTYPFLSWYYQQIVIQAYSCSQIKRIVCVLPSTWLYTLLYGITGSKHKAIFGKIAAELPCRFYYYWYHARAILLRQVIRRNDLNYTNMETLLSTAWTAYAQWITYYWFYWRVILIKCISQSLL